MNELSYFFKIMTNLSAAKAGDDVEGLADCIADLEAMAMHSETSRIRANAAATVASASALLADLQAQRFGYSGPTVVAIGAHAPANFN